MRAKQEEISLLIIMVACELCLLEDFGLINETLIGCPFGCPFQPSNEIEGSWNLM